MLQLHAGITRPVKQSELRVCTEHYYLDHAITQITEKSAEYTNMKKSENRMAYVQFYPVFGALSVSSNLSYKSKSLSSLEHLKKSLDEKLKTMDNKIKCNVQRNSKYLKTRQLGEIEISRTRTKNPSLRPATAIHSTQVKCTQTPPKETSLQKVHTKQMADRRRQKKKYNTSPPSRNDHFFKDIIYQDQKKEFEDLKELKVEDVLESSPKQTPVNSELLDLLTGELKSGLSKQQGRYQKLAPNPRYQQLHKCFLSNDIQRTKSVPENLRSFGKRKLEVRIPSMSSSCCAENCFSTYLVSYRHKPATGISNRS